MTDITDQDRRAAREWAEAIGSSDAPVPAHLWLAASRVILATVPAPAPTLADELRDLGALLEEEGGAGAKSTCWAKDLADRAAQIEQERDEYRMAAEAEADLHDESRAEVERLTAERDKARAELGEACDELANAEYDRHNLRAEVERLTAEVESMTTQKEAADAASEENAVDDEGQAPTTLPDPADVPAGQAWIVKVNGEPRTAVKDGENDGVPWSTVTPDGEFLGVEEDRVTLVCPLVPLTDLIDQAATTTAETITKALGTTAHRTVNTVEELDGLPDSTIVRGGDGHSWENVDGRWCGHRSFGDISPESLATFGPVTVLWEPEA